MTNEAWLLKHSRNVYSQSGEDGILEKVFERLLDKSGWCVEFGAWDGLHHSNTAHMIRSQSYSAVMIEADHSRFEDLGRTYAAFPAVHLLRARVGFEAHNSLDVLLRATPIPQEFDLLSIDIDGNDYHVWDTVRDYTPRCVVIEYNPTIPNGVHFVQPRDPQVMQGASLDALVELGRRKGYQLVAATRFNGIFVRNEDFLAFEIGDNSVHTLRQDLSLVTHIFCGYDGTVFIRGYRKLPWHGVSYAQALRQPLPWFLRTWRGNYGFVQSRLFSLLARARKAREEDWSA